MIYARELDILRVYCLLCIDANAAFLWTLLCLSIWMNSNRNIIFWFFPDKCFEYFCSIEYEQWMCPKTKPRPSGLACFLAYFFFFLRIYDGIFRWQEPADVCSVIQIKSKTKEEMFRWNFSHFPLFHRSPIVFKGTVHLHNAHTTQFSYFVFFFLLSFAVHKDWFGHKFQLLINSFVYCLRLSLDTVSSYYATGSGVHCEDLNNESSEVNPIYFLDSI